ncbi:hypothetical protein FOL47_001486 [Perkinsus chesapeaki]|uniref:RING-type domain-containing protein n=1 Tax=Perkinsus chesapeaki TaxID=330153 RepID=A0A7J6MIY2_PERCH|nr:hypothetical protein FOL47_001486 [Perkinsus chesapeaki]
MISFLRYTFSKRFLVCWLVWSVGVISFGIVAAIIPTAAGGSITETLIVLLVYLIVVGILPPLLILVYSRRCYKEDRQREESMRLWQLGYGHVGSRCRNLPKGASKGFKKEWKQWSDQNTRLCTWREVKYDATGEDVCAICLVKFADSDKIRELPCKHTFHVECFNSCFSSLPRPLVPGSQHRCPLCRTPLGPTLAGAPPPQRQQSTTTGPMSRRNSL